MLSAAIYCKVLKGLGEEQLQEIVTDDDLDTNDNPDVPLEEYFEIKPRIRLPNSDTALVDVSLSESSVDNVTRLMMDSIYDYFRDTCGVIENCNKDLSTKYKDHSIKSLKKQLKALKYSKAPILEIKYVSGLIRTLKKPQRSM